MRTSREIAENFAEPSSLNGVERLFLVGIGGAGMSGLARLARWKEGLHVAGTDSARSDETDALIAEGFPVIIGHDGAALEEFALGRTALVLSDAISLEDSPEVAVARRLKIPLVRRSALLGWLVRDKRVIAVTGTHGKTTTTGMTGAALLAAGLDPLVVVGAAVPQWGGPVLFGRGDWAVVEACEAYDGFHDLDPEIAVLTNLEPDHLDYHGDWHGLRGSVMRFVGKLPSEGLLVYSADDAGATAVAAVSGARAYGYPPLTEVKMALPGAKNAANAGAALAVAEALGADRLAALAGIASFTGGARRLQILRDDADIAVIDDYAHHPTEIHATIDALREKFPARRLVVVFQPHLYSRTRDHLEGFAKALDEADLVVLTDIYPAREQPIPGISSARIAAILTTPHRYVPALALLPRAVKPLIGKGDMVVGMGAGTISRFAPALLKELARPDGPRSVVVLMGGDNAEREVSLLSGRAAANALRGKDFDVRELDLTAALLETGDLSPLTGEGRPDVVFLALHGPRGEDGAIQGLLEAMHLPYTGSGIAASALAMDKNAAKKALSAAGLPVPQGQALRKGDPIPAYERPVVVKPNTQGSTVGLTFVRSAEELEAAIERAHAYDEIALVEELLEGMEITIPFLVDRVLPVVEIVPVAGDYDFANKYTPGATAEIVPARLPDETSRGAQRLAIEAHRILGCSGASRTDMIVTSRGPVILEVNTLPGLTGTSLLPTSAAAAGIPYGELCERLVRDAWERRGAV